MAPQKGQGTSKGKQPAIKAPPKRLAVELSGSDDEGEMEDQMAILEQKAALKKAQGLSPGELDSTGASSRSTSQKHFQAEVCNQLSFLAALSQGCGDRNWQNLY